MTGDRIGVLLNSILDRMWLLLNLLTSKNLKQILIKAPEKGLQLPSLSLTSVVDVLVADRA